MGRPKDEHYWNQVTKEANGMLKCNHCGHKFKGGVSRIKAHVDRKPGQGIKLCSSIEPGSVPDNAGSSNPQEYVEEMNSLGGCKVPMDSTIGSCSDAIESEISDLKKSFHDLSHEEDDINRELQWMEFRDKKRKREVDDWLEKAGELKKRAYKMIHLVDLGGSPDLSRVEIQQLTKRLREVNEEKPLVLSNESARRSRMRKQLEDLTDEVSRLQGSNGKLVESVKAKEEARVENEAENRILRAQTMELADRLRFLNSILEIAEKVSGFSVEIPQIPDPLLKPWQIPHPIQPIVASADTFLR